MSLIHNERIKLTANWLNAISAASIAVGGFAQLAPLFPGTSPASPPLIVAFGLGWMLFGLLPHWLGRVTLGWLRK